MSNRVNIIVKRIYYAVEIHLCSPLALSNGENETTDMDVLRNSQGEAFIPGTSVAGAFRNYLQKEKTQECSFGFSKGEEGRMSSVSISDIYFDKTPTITVRDGVQLSEGKHVVNKFDMEIIESGAAGMLYLNYVIRENDLNMDLEQEVRHLLHAVQYGEIRFGGNKNRGFGRLAVGKIYERIFTVDNVKKWIAFSRKFRDISAYVLKKDYKEWIQEYHVAEPQYDTLRIPLKLTGGISIRKYSAEPVKADFEHITCNDRAIVPGMSWNGAIRADVKRILLQLGCSAAKANLLIDQWFGYVLENNQKAKKQKGKEPDAQQSLVVIGESVLCHSVRVPMTRNKINRFDASTIESALYSEIMNCGGETELEIMVRKNENRGYCALLAVLELVAQDICKGYVAVGGQTAVGRGIFSGSADGLLDEEIKKRGQDELLSLIEGKEE